MKADDFVNIVNQGITLKSGLRRIKVDDIRLWANKGFFKSVPNYYHYDIRTVLALLQLELIPSRAISFRERSILATCWSLTAATWSCSSTLTTKALEQEPIKLEFLKEVAVA